MPERMALQTSLANHAATKARRPSVGIAGHHLQHPRRFRKGEPGPRSAVSASGPVLSGRADARLHLYRLQSLQSLPCLAASRPCFQRFQRGPPSERRAFSRSVRACREFGACVAMGRDRLRKAPARSSTPPHSQAPPSPCSPCCGPHFFAGPLRHSATSSRAWRAGLGSPIRAAMPLLAYAATLAALRLVKIRPRRSQYETACRARRRS
jgi:hypothetical protein